MLRNRIALSLVLSSLIAPTATLAKTVQHPASKPVTCQAGYRRAAVMVRKRVHKHGRWVVVKRHGKVVWNKQRVKQHGRWVVVQHCVRQSATAKPQIAKRAPSPAPAPAAQPALRAPTLGIGGNLAALNGCADSMGDSVVRIIVFNYEPLDRFLDCARNEVAHGHRLIVSINYNTAWSIGQDQQWFQQAIAMWAPLHPIEISVGNEEEFTSTPAQYVAVWNAVHNMIPAGILKGAGEISPWHLDWFKQAVAMGLPGADVYAGHAYPAGGVGFQPSAFLALAQQNRKMAWATEGRRDAGAWPKFGSRPASDFAGYELAVEWFTNGIA